MLLPKPGNCSGIWGLRYIRLKGYTRYTKEKKKKNHPHHNHKSPLNSHPLFKFLISFPSQTKVRTLDFLMPTEMKTELEAIKPNIFSCQRYFTILLISSSKICPFKSQYKNSVAQQAANSYSHLCNLFQKIRMALKEGNAA